MKTVSLWLNILITKSLQANVLFFCKELSMAIFYRELRTELVTPFIFKITPLCGPHGKHHFPLLWIHVYSCIAWQQTFYSSMSLLGADHIENTVSFVLLPVFLFTELLPGNALITSVKIRCVCIVSFCVTADIYLLELYDAACLKASCTLVS
jgi:hypothetical protein